MKNIYWVGSRESDVFDDNLFFGSITRFGTDKNNNRSFCNNIFTDDYQIFVRTYTQKLSESNPEVYFIFANEMTAYQCGEAVFKKALCLNRLSVIEALNNKIFVRNYMSKVVNIPECIIINSSSVSDTAFIKSIFNHSFNEFVIQSAYGAGGEETILLSNYEGQHFYEQQVLVTPYIYNSIPINVHIAVSGSEYRIFPPSIQLILDDFKYSGSDYIKYHDLSYIAKKNIINACVTIAKKVCSLGCNGIFGVDLIVKNDMVLFLECNYRYQGSSFLLSKALVENGYPSIFRIQHDAFYNNLHNIPIDIHLMSVNYSSFRRTNSNKSIKLPIPYELKKDGDHLKGKLRNGYIQYEIFQKSIIDLIQK